MTEAPPDRTVSGGLVSQGPAGDLAPGHLFDVSDVRLRDPQWYATAQTQLVHQLGSGRLKALHHKQASEALEALCQQNLHMSIEEASRQQASALERCVDALMTSDNDITKLEEIFARVEDLKDEVKKKCLSLLARTRELQRQAREDPIKAWLYIGRDSEGRIPEDRQDRYGAGFFDVQWFHVAIFQAFEDKRWQKRLVEAPPGHGKTTIARWWVATKIGREPWRRICWLSDVEDKAEKEVRLLDNIISHARYKAIYPDLRIQDRNENSERSGRRFTVSRINVFSREPTVEGWGINGGINGSGYDILVVDDICDETIRAQPVTRKQILDRFDSVVRQRLRNWEFAELTFICTPWHAEDVAGTLEDRVARGQERGWLVLKEGFRILDDKEGKAIPLWAKFPQAVLEDFKVSASYNQTHRLETHRDEERKITELKCYNSEPNNPLTDDGDRALLKAIESAERHLSLDPSATNARYSSDTGAADMRLTGDELAFCANIWTHHKGPVQMQNWVIRELYFAEPKYRVVQIEGQGGMKGQATLWVHAIRQALEQGRIPTTVEGDRIETLEPLNDMPLFRITDTRVGGFVQNRDKMQRLHDCARYLQLGWVRFAGRKYKDPGADHWRYRPIPHSIMDTFEFMIVHFDGTNKSDAIDAVTQWILDNKHRIRNPHLRIVAPDAAERLAGMTGAFRKQVEAMKQAKPKTNREGLFYAGIQKVG